MLVPPKPPSPPPLRVIRDGVDIAQPKLSKPPKVTFTFDGVDYWWNGGGLGCQLESLEWWGPAAGTTRVLDFGPGRPWVEVSVYSTARAGLKIRATWTISSKGSYDELRARISDLRHLLASMVS